MEGQGGKVTIIKVQRLYVLEQARHFSFSVFYCPLLQPLFLDLAGQPQDRTGRLHRDCAEVRL